MEEETDMSKKDKIKIPENQKKKCNVIIHGASVAAGGVGTGLAQIPLADNALIAPIQIGMIIALGKVFDQEISKTAAQVILGGAAASTVGRGISQVLVGWIPGVGNAINTATAAAVTEAVGWMVVDNFSKNAYIDIIKQNPLTKEEQDKMTDKHETDSENIEFDRERDKLIARAEEFFQGKKDKKNNKSEYNELLNDFEKILFDVSDNDPLYNVFAKLSDL